MNTFNVKNILKAVFGFALAFSLVGSAQCALAPEFDKKSVSELETKQTMCVICREDLGNNGIMCTPCMHLFHDACLRQALTGKKACPLCRLNFETHPDFLAMIFPVQPAAADDMQPQHNIRHIVMVNDPLGAAHQAAQHDSQIRTLNDADGNPRYFLLPTGDGRYAMVDIREWGIHGICRLYEILRAASHANSLRF
jgi:hypothetical protein